MPATAQGLSLPGKTEELSREKGCSEADHMSPEQDQDGLAGESTELMAARFLILGTLVMLQYQLQGKKKP